MIFDADAYWRSMGKWLAGPGAMTPEHKVAEERLSVVLAGIDDDVVDVLDVGCGRGRLATLLRDVLPLARYYGVDVGPDQVQATAEARPDGTIVLSRIQDFAPGRKWDLVLCSEVLMHIPPADIEAVASVLLGLTRRYLLMIEWVPEPAELLQPIAPENWPHDYEGLFGPFAHVERLSRQNLMLVKRDG